MNNEEKIREILNCENCRKQLLGGGVKCPPTCADYNDLMKMAQWKDEQLNNLKDEIQSNLCASSGFNDEYSHGYQDCGMKVMEMIDKILN